VRDADGSGEALALAAPNPIFTNAPQWPVRDCEFKPLVIKRPVQIDPAGTRSEFNPNAG